MPSLLFSQVKGDFVYIEGDDTSHIPFMYLGRDTLDYADGGSQHTKVKIDTVIYDSINSQYFIVGNLSEAQTGESYGDWGIVVLGRIELARADTWLGHRRTGVIVNKSVLEKTSNGQFKIAVPQNYQDSVIFTGEGGSTVIDIPFQEIVSKYYDRKVN